MITVPYLLLSSFCQFFTADFLNYITENLVLFVSLHDDEIAVRNFIYYFVIRQMQAIHE